jgi:hypothetical protein
MADLAILSTDVVAEARGRTWLGVAGEAIVAGQAVYRDDQTRRWRLADADSVVSASRDGAGIALTTSSEGQPITVVRAGPVDLGSVLEPGSPYCVSATAGGICPYDDLIGDDYVCLLGLALSDRILDLDIQYLRVPAPPSILERFLALPGLAAAYTTRDPSSVYQVAGGGSESGVGLPAGLVIDKHLLGAQTVETFLANQSELIADADELAGWTVKTPADGSLSLVDGKLRFNVSATNWAYRSFATTIGAWYRLDGLAEAVGTESPFYCIRKADSDTASVNAVNLSGNSTLSGALFFKATAETTFLVLQVNSTATTYDVDFSGVGVKAVPGFPAVSDATDHRPFTRWGRYLEFDEVDDVLYAQIGEDLGDDCSVYYYTQAGEHVWEHGVTIGAGAYALSTTAWVAAAIFSGPATEEGLTQAWGVAQITPPLPDGWLSVNATFDDNVFQSLEFDGEDALGLVTTDVDGYTVDGSSNLPEFYATGACTVTIEYELDSDYVGHPPSGEPFGFFTAHPMEFAFRVYTGDGTNSHAMWFRLSDPAYSTPEFQYPSDGFNPEKKARRRVTVALEEGQQPRALADNYITRTEAIQGPVPVLGAPTKMTFLKSARYVSPTRPFVNGKLHKIQVRVGALSNAEMEAIHLSDLAAPPLHMLGDSFVNGGQLIEAVMENFAATDNGYVPFSYDAEGGRGLTVHAGRFAGYVAKGYTKWYDPTLIIMEGGPDDDGPTSVAMIGDIIGRLTHDRWVFVESSPQEYLPGSADRDAYEAKMDAIRTYCGDHWLPNLALITNTDPEAGTIFHDGSENDLADCANDIWPRSLRMPGDVIHPSFNVTYANSAGWWGNGALGKIIYDGLVSRGYLP